jgi:hypothetical protein
MVLSQKINRISPLARAILVIGAIAALVTGVTYAQLTSNTVTLTNNTLAAASAHLVLESGDTDCTGVTTTTGVGMSFENLVPGVESEAFDFCLGNDGEVPLDISVSIPTDISGSTIPADKVTLKLVCDDIGTVEDTLDAYNAPLVFGDAPLDNADLNGVGCAATAKLAEDVTGGSVTPFQLNFVGTQEEAPAPPVGP